MENEKIEVSLSSLMKERIIEELSMKGIRVSKINSIKFSVDKIRIKYNDERMYSLLLHDFVLNDIFYRQDEGSSISL